MKKQLKGLLIVILILTVATLCSLYLNGYFKQDNTNTTQIHTCTWEDCDHQGEVINQWLFVSQWGYEEMTDGWCVEMTHFMDPQLSYEECEQYVFSGVE